MRSFGRKAIALLLCEIFMLGAFATIASAAEKCPVIEGSNLNGNDYPYYWSDVISSYIVPITGGNYLRFQASAVPGKYLAEYYNRDFNLSHHLLIEEELPVFGGFYASDSNYYILSGQNNPTESSRVECFRITKYDLNWNRIKSVGLYNCNTCIPFDAGSARFAQHGKYLFIRTCHEMYRSDDGYNHQANVTIQLNTETMEIIDELTDVSHVSTGYVSHSFNQFIKTDGNKLVALDHGDAHLRSLIITEYPREISEEGFYSWDCNYTEAVPIPGEYGDNYTGVELGGFEIPQSNYIIAYSAVKLDDNFRSYSTKNVYITTVNKTTKECLTKQLTHIPEGSTGTGCPQLVRISNNNFMVLWQDTNGVNYLLIDENGNPIGKEGLIENGYLSDCAPIYNDGKVIWYTYSESITEFYQIDTALGKAEKKTVISGHDEKILNYPTEQDPYCKVECQKCNDIRSIDVCDGFTIYWNTNGGEGYYYTSPEDVYLTAGDRIYFLVNTDGDGNGELEFTYGNGKALQPVWTFDDQGYIAVEESGSYSITASLKYDPRIYHSVYVEVDGINSGADKSSLGDVNLNGKIDARDYLLLKRAFFGTYEFNDEQNERGDINGNGKLDARDYLLLKRVFFGTFSL